MSESRTSKSIKNAQVTIFFYFLSMIIGFWSRKVLFDCLGGDVLGLEGTAGTLLSFLNLAELGIGSSVAYFLFKPMHDQDHESINEIVSLQKWIYQRVAYFILGGSAILMFFFPIIYKDIKIPLWYAYASYSVMLFNSVIGYFVAYRYIILSVDQKDYQVQKVTQFVSLGSRVLLVFALPYVSNTFIFYIGVNLFAGIITLIPILLLIKKDYPWLKKSPLSGKELLKKHPGVMQKTKQIFIHRIAQVIIIEIQPMIMYGFSTLSAVAYYGNYVASLGKARDIIASAFGSIQCGIGNLVASGDKKRIWDVFWELLDSRIYIGACCLMVLGVIVEPFISVWLSPKYLLGSTFLCILIAQYWISINRKTIENYLVGYGLFQDVWAPVVEAIIYLSAAVTFGSLWGLNGVLAGALTSNILIIRIWKPYFLFTRGFKRNPVTDYFIPYIKRLVLVLANAVLFVWANNRFVDKSQLDSFLSLFIYGIILSAIVFPIMYVEFMLFSPGFRAFSARMQGLINGKIAELRGKLPKLRIG